VLLFGLSPRDYLRGAPAGYVPERLRFPERWRVAPLLHALAAARSRKQARERAEGVLGLLGLQSESERRVGELSRGTLQRVGIAQALLDEPAVLILDEPTEGLDPLWRLRLRGILAEQRARGAAVLLASHDLAELERSVDRVVVLERGAITRELTARAPGGGGRYRIRARSGGEHLGAAFPNPQSTGDDEYEVEVTDANELSARLAAWLAQGAVLESVRPAGLEEQLRGSFGAER
jgi:ABC-type multidrug transport system ATPase subunit